MTTRTTPIPLREWQQRAQGRLNPKRWHIEPMSYHVHPSIMNGESPHDRAEFAARAYFARPTPETLAAWVQAVAATKQRPAKVKDQRVTRVEMTATYALTMEQYQKAKRYARRSGGMFTIERIP